MIQNKKKLFELFHSFNMKNTKLVFNFSTKTTISFSPNNSYSHAWNIIQHLDRKEQQEVIQLEAYFLQNVHCCLLKANELHLQTTSCIDVPWHNNKPLNFFLSFVICECNQMKVCNIPNGRTLCIAIVVSQFCV
jgi:beta-xylosidase